MQLVLPIGWNWPTEVLEQLKSSDAFTTVTEDDLETLIIGLHNHKYNAFVYPLAHFPISPYRSVIPMALLPRESVAYTLVGDPLLRDDTLDFGWQKGLQIYASSSDKAALRQMLAWRPDFVPVDTIEESQVMLQPVHGPRANKTVLHASEVTPPAAAGAYAIFGRQMDHQTHRAVQQWHTRGIAPLTNAERRLSAIMQEQGVTNLGCQAHQEKDGRYVMYACVDIDGQVKHKSVYSHTFIGLEQTMWTQLK